MHKKIVLLLAVLSFVLPWQAVASNEEILDMVNYAESCVQYNKNFHDMLGPGNPKFSHSFARKAILPGFNSDCNSLNWQKMQEKYSGQIAFILGVVKNTNLKNFNLTKIVKAIRLSIGTEQYEHLLSLLIKILYKEALVKPRELLSLIELSQINDKKAKNQYKNIPRLDGNFPELMFLEGKAVARNISKSELMRVFQISKLSSLDNEVLLHSASIMILAGKYSIAADMISRACLLNPSSIDFVNKDKFVAMLKKSFRGYKNIVNGLYRPRVKDGRFPGIDEVSIIYSSSSKSDKNAQKRLIRWENGKYVESNFGIDIPAALISRLYNEAIKVSRSDARFCVSMRTKKDKKANLQNRAKTGFDIIMTSQFDKKDLKIQSYGSGAYMLPCVVTYDSSVFYCDSKKLGKMIYLLINWLGIKNKINTNGHFYETKPSDKELNALKKRISNINKSIPLWKLNGIALFNSAEIDKVRGKSVLSGVLSYQHKTTFTKAKVNFNFVNDNIDFGRSNVVSQLSSADVIYSRLETILGIKRTNSLLFEPISKKMYDSSYSKFETLIPELKSLIKFHKGFKDLGDFDCPYRISINEQKLKFVAIYFPGTQEIIVEKFKIIFDKANPSIFESTIIEKLAITEQMQKDLEIIQYKDKHMKFLFDDSLQKNYLLEYANNTEFSSNFKQALGGKIMDINFGNTGGNLAINADNSINFL